MPFPGGQFLFMLDGSPLELYIELSFDSFMELNFAGGVWRMGYDYAVRPGSTIISIESERLERYEDGGYWIHAVFSDQIVEVIFTLARPDTDTHPPLRENDGLCTLK